MIIVQVTRTFLVLNEVGTAAKVVNATENRLGLAVTTVYVLTLSNVKY